MAFKFFLVPIQDGETAEAELNAFLRSHAVLSVERRWVDQGPASFWSFCVGFVETQAPGEKGGRSTSQRARVDYRELLKDDDFAVFAKLRDLRKEIAQAEGTPVYTIFNNDQLAQMVQKRARSKADLEAILGVGEARVEKYGARFLEVLSSEKNPADETGEKPV